ncbi:hypothetical protein P691DRAFT_716558 [Macrolepiota fuliginosa MF-IS2]|uniref:Sas10 C-terminal domain-containing protein n=1 Tax=Macrolepiota fuliginosa MF-IS2 TaxID=1400762 RepID=A0A9P5XS31_9AGAR|nr:hypothetical protein P691DRAFT_716558 [Macrolepiota fuliginosa MF-IS2]
MPRRPSKKSKGSKPRPVKKSDATLNRWETADDIPLDEEDAFHTSRDKILLDGETYGGDDDGDDDEIFALKGLQRDEDSEEDYGEGEEEYGSGNDDDNVDSVPSRPKKDKKKKGKQKSSDNEDEEDEETWGRGKASYYSSNAAQLESDDEEGHELEEQEAMRLQRKALEDMNDDDFGLKDRHEISWTDDSEEQVAEASSSIISSLPTDRRSLLRHLEKTNPEAIALARDWDDTVWTLMKTRKRIAQLQSTEPDILSAGMAHLHYQALLTYATTLAFYLHLRASPKYAQRPELLTFHPIMQRLLTLKQSVSTLEDLGFTLSDSEPEFDEDDDESLDLTDEEDKTEGLWQTDRKKGLEPGELDDLLEDAQLSVSFAPSKSKPVMAPPLADKPPKKKRKLSSETSETPTKPIFDLEEPEFAPSAKSNSRLQTEADDDAYGEATHLQAVDVADKSARKKSLRFHTSKIESTSARRQGARNQAMGGDDDVPYRDRQKEKEARLLREAKNRIQNQGGEDLDGTEPPERISEKRRRGNDSDDDGSSDEPNGYYELVKQKSKEKKEQKKAEYEAARATERFVEEDEVDGPRSLTRAILTNKGLTPHRSKAVRNPRVKKRQKFEKAKKKLASQKAVYKGGLSQSGGRYEGEKSGISKVVKSVKLG